jgi:hypothetical protein
VTVPVLVAAAIVELASIIVLGVLLIVSRRQLKERAASIGLP